jgi:O-Antigen ligase
MTERLPKGVLFAGAMVLVPLLVYMAYTHPVLFSNQTSLGGLIALELLLVALWMYRRIFFALVLLGFFSAGTDVPLSGFWTTGRWIFLIAGAFVGCFIMLKERQGRFTLFHALAVFAVLSALVSAAVSRFPNFALLKAVSLLMLFLYAGTGARLAVAGREQRFFVGLLMGSEILVAAIGALYFLGREVMGNPNSLGAVMAVVAPILLWGTLIDSTPLVRHRRLLFFIMCMYMLFFSQSRAGLLAGFLSCGLLCLALRKYKLFGQGLVVLLIVITSAAIFNPDAFSKTMASLTSSIVYKDKDPAQGVFGSRQEPWKAATESIRKHLWFGSGFGTTDTGQDADAHLSKYTTTAESTSENGSSYLTIVSWVGVAGVIPFFLVLLALLSKILRTLLWMYHTGSPFHPAVPVAMVLVAGLLHAIFEDWLFAPGYYVCVFFWSFAFIFVDLAPWAPLPSFSIPWRPWLMRPTHSVAPSR